MNEEELARKSAEAMRDVVKKMAEEGVTVPENIKSLPDEISKMKGDFEGKFVEFKGELADLAAKAINANQKEEPKTAIKQYEEFLLSLKAKEGGISGQVKSRRGFEFQAKAVSNMVTSYAIASGSRIPLWEREPGVAKSPYRMPFIQDLIVLARTSSDTVSWVERTLVEGGPAQVAEGSTYAQMSETFEEKNATAKYTAVYMKISDKMLDDIDFMLSEAQTEIVDQMELVIDAQLLSGDGTGQNHKGILEYATAFAKPTGTNYVTAPNGLDVLRVAILQLITNNFVPSAITLNPIDAANFDLIKTTTGEYMLPPFYDRNGKMILGIRVVENNGVTVGNFLVGDFSKSTFFLRDSLNIRVWDQNSDDPVKGFKTITGRVRGIHRIKAPHTKAFVKGTFAAGITALTAP
jgi:HK97 family phage major capsid protein